MVILKDEDVIVWHACNVAIVTYVNDYFLTLLLQSANFCKLILTQFMNNYYYARNYYQTHPFRHK